MHLILDFFIALFMETITSEADWVGGQRAAPIPGPPPTLVLCIPLGPGARATSYL